MSILNSRSNFNVKPIASLLCVELFNISHYYNKSQYPSNNFKGQLWSGSCYTFRLISASPSFTYCTLAAGLLDVPWVLQAHSHPRAFVPVELLSRMTSSLLSHCPAFIFFNYFLQSHLLKESFLISMLRCCNPLPGILGSCEGVFLQGNSFLIECFWDGQKLEFLFSFCWYYLPVIGFWEKAGRSMSWYTFRGPCGRGRTWIETWRIIKTNKSLGK